MLRVPQFTLIRVRDDRNIYQVSCACGAESILDMKQDDMDVLNCIYCFCAIQQHHDQAEGRPKLRVVEPALPRVLFG